MHILFVTELYPEYEDQPHLEMNPALHHFVTEWIKSGVDVTVIVPVVTRNILHPLQKKPIKKKKIDNVRVIYIPIFKIPGFKIYNCSEIVHFSRDIPFDIIVSHLQIGLVAGYAVKRDSRRPLIFGVHISDITVLDIPSPNYKKRLFKQKFLHILKRVDGFSFRSHSVHTEFVKNYNINPKPYTIAMSGISSSCIHDKPIFTYHNPSRIITACRLINSTFGVNH